MKLNIKHFLMGMSLLLRLFCASVPPIDVKRIWLLTFSANFKQSGSLSVFFPRSYRCWGVKKVFSNCRRRFVPLLWYCWWYKMKVGVVFFFSSSSLASVFSTSTAETHTFTFSPLLFFYCNSFARFLPLLLFIFFFTRLAFSFRFRALFFFSPSVFLRNREIKSIPQCPRSTGSAVYLQKHQCACSDSVRVIVLLRVWVIAALGKLIYSSAYSSSSVNTFCNIPNWPYSNKRYLFYQIHSSLTCIRQTHTRVRNETGQRTNQKNFVRLILLLLLLIFSVDQSELFEEKEAVAPEDVQLWQKLVGLDLRSSQADPRVTTSDLPSCECDKEKGLSNQF